MKINTDKELSYLFEAKDSDKNKHLKYAEKFLNGQLIVQAGLESIPIEENIDWNYIHPVSSNTYTLYLHTLNFIKYLTLAYEKQI